MEQNDIIEEIVEIPAGNSEEKVGNIKISVDVVASIAGIATTEIKGVAGMNNSFAGGIAEIFSAKKNLSRGVKVEITENDTIIDLFIIVNYGIRIPELAWEIQENVKKSVETMTGLNVEKVNIHIEGVNFAKENPSTDVPDDDEDEEIIIEDTDIDILPENVDEIDNL